jgi:hypothetical protein
MLQSGLLKQWMKHLVLTSQEKIRKIPQWVEIWMREQAHFNCARRKLREKSAQQSLLLVTENPLSDFYKTFKIAWFWPGR